MKYKKCDSTQCYRRILAHIAYCCMACELYGKHNKKCNDHHDYFGEVE